MQRRGAAGFTLIELIAVMALIGLIAMFAVLRIDWAVPKYALRSAGNRLGGICAMARGYAVSRGRAFYVEYDLKGRKVTLSGPVLSPDEAEAKGAEEFIPLPAVAPADRWEEVLNESLPSGVEFEDVWIGAKRADGDRVRIEFSPLGTADTHTVHLKGEGERKMTVHVNGVTGTPTYYEERWEPKEPKRADAY